MTNEIDWTKAPEGATHYAKVDGEIVYYKTNGDQIFGCHDTEWVHDSSSKCWLMNNTHKIPEPSTLCGTSSKPLQPVFSKAMQDNNELPPVGSKAICEYQDGVELLIVAHDLLNEDGAFALVCDSTGYWGAEARRWKPIDTRTDKEKAIDNLMFFGDQGQDSEAANFNLEAIIAGKITGVKWTGKS